MKLFVNAFASHFPGGPARVTCLEIFEKIMLTYILKIMIRYILKILVTYNIHIFCHYLSRKHAAAFESNNNEIYVYM